MTNSQSLAITSENIDRVFHAIKEASKGVDTADLMMSLELFDELVIRAGLENWREIAGYDCYQISDLGRIRSLARDIDMPNGQKRHVLEIIMSTKSEVHGHPVVWLSKEGKDKKHFVHRLVAEAFLIPPTSDVVNHKDLNKKNNRLWNLEWATFSQNTQHYHDNKNKDEAF